MPFKNNAGTRSASEWGERGEEDRARRRRDRGCDWRTSIRWVSPWPLAFISSKNSTPLVFCQTSIHLIFPTPNSNDKEKSIRTNENSWLRRVVWYSQNDIPLLDELIFCFPEIVEEPPTCLNISFFKCLVQAEWNWKKCRFSVQMVLKADNTFSSCNQCLKTPNVAFNGDAMFATIVAHSISFTCTLRTQRMAYKPFWPRWLSLLCAIPCWLYLFLLQTVDFESVIQDIRVIVLYGYCRSFSPHKLFSSQTHLQPETRSKALLVLWDFFAFRNDNSHYTLSNYADVRSR